MTYEQLRLLHGRLDSATTGLLLDLFVARYQQEIAAEEDVFRTLPFFASALLVEAAGAGYVAQNLPCTLIAGLFAAPARMGATGLAAVLLGVAVLAAACLTATAMILLLRATRGMVQLRPADEAQILAWVARQSRLPARLSQPELDLAMPLRRALVRNLAEVTPGTRARNRERYRLRAQAAQCLIGSLLSSFTVAVAIFLFRLGGVFP